MLLGYIRYRNTYPLEVKEILAENNDAEKIISYIMKNKLKRINGEVILSLSLKNTLMIFDNSENICIEEKIRTSDYLMMKVIDNENKLLEQYIQEAKISDNNLGVITFPPMFDIDD